MRYYDLELNPAWDYRLYPEGEALYPSDYALDSAEPVLSLRGSATTRTTETERR